VKPFTFVRPTSVAEAVGALESGDGGAQVIAGGQSLLLAMKERLERPSVLVSLRDVAEVIGVSYGDDGTLEIGAATTYWNVQAAEYRTNGHTLLSTVVQDVADVPVKRMGTVGGALCQADPIFDFPLAAVVAEAEVELASSKGSRRLPVSEFLQGPFTTALEPGELLTTIRFPSGVANARTAFVKHRLRRFDPALASVACILVVGDDGRVESARIACGAVGPVPVRVTAAEELLVGNPVTDELAQEAGEKAADAMLEHVGQKMFRQEYRKDVLPVLVARALGAAYANGKE
jgi:carbon-monoxide dehydrogenase medium subunit